MNFQATRSEMHQHDENSKPNHEILLLSTVKNLKEQSNQKDVEIEQLKATNANKNETLNKLKRDFEELKNQFQQMTKKNETKEEQTTHLLNEIVENQTQKSQELINDVDNLKKFSEYISRLHHTLSEKWLRGNLDEYTLLNKNYNQDEDVENWNEMVNEINEDENECNYLKTLKSSINRYKETVYSTSYEERLLNFSYSSPLGDFRGDFIRVGCSGETKSICVKLIKNNFSDFKKEVEKSDKRRVLKVQHDYSTCSYYIGDCFHVLLALNNEDFEAFFLHKSNEDETLHLPNGKEVKIDDIEEYRFNASIFLWIS